MVISGRVHNGVVVLEGDLALPEGAAVAVTYPVPPAVAPNQPKRRIQIPLVHSELPGSVDLTNERIASIMDEEDVSPRY